MDHNEERFASDPEIPKMFKLIVDFFLNEIKLDFVSKAEVYHIIGVLLTNGFENDHEGVQGRAIYPNLSLASHACRANLRHAVSPGYQVALQVRYSFYFQVVYTQFHSSLLKTRTGSFDNVFLVILIYHLVTLRETRK